MQKMEKMEALEKGKNKLGEICEILRKETLEPAQNEASSIIEKAEENAKAIVERARLEAEKIIQEAQSKIEQERKLFESSMDLAVKQTFNHLQEKIQTHFFNDQLSQLAASIMNDSALASQIVAAIVQSIDKESVNSNLSLALSNAMNPEDIAKHLSGKILETLKNGEITVESISSGAKVMLKDQNVTVEVSPESLKELMGQFLKDSFRKILFKNT